MYYPSIGFIVKRVMKDEDILSHVDPMLKEYYSSYLLVGFKADSGHMSCIGDMGKLNDKSGHRRKLKPFYELMKKMVAKEDEKNS